MLPSAYLGIVGRDNSLLAYQFDIAAYHASEIKDDDDFRPISELSQYG